MATFSTIMRPFKLERYSKDIRISIWLRVITQVFNVIGIIFMSRALSLQGLYYTDGLGVFTDIFPLCGFGWSLIWTSVSLGLYFGRVLYHPGVDVGLDLVSWLLTLLMFVFGAIFGLGGLPYYASNCYDRTDVDLSCDDDPALLLTVIEKMGVIMCLVITVLHFIVFVRACRFTHARRMQDKQKTVVYVDLETLRAVLKE